MKGGRITCSSGSHNLQVLEGGATPSRARIQPWDYNSWSKGPVPKLVHVDGTLRDGFNYRAIFNFQPWQSPLFHGREEQVSRKVLVERMRERTRYSTFLREILSTGSFSTKLGARDVNGACFNQKVARQSPRKSSPRRCWITRDSNARARGSRGENRAVHVWKRGAMIQISGREMSWK